MTPGVVDEHVDAAVPLDDLVDPRGERRPVGDRGDGARPALHGVPGILEGVGDEPADAARGAGHDGDEVATAAVLGGRLRRDLALVVDRHLGGHAHARCTAPTASAAARERGVAQGADLVGGQRAVGRPEGEPVGQGLAPLPHLVAAVDVEQRQRLEVGPGTVAQRALHGIRGHRLVDDDGDVALGHREGRAACGPARSPPTPRSARRGRARRRPCGPAARAPRRPWGAARRRGRRGCRRPAPRGRSGRGGRAARHPRTPRARGRGPRRRCARARRRRRRRPGGRRPTSRPAPGRRRAAARRGAAAAGTAARMAASVSSDGWMPTSSVGAERCGPSRATTRPSSKSPTSRVPAGDVAAQRVDHRREQPGAHQRLLVGQRVGQAHGARHLGVDVEPERGVAVGADERRAPHLGQALAGQHVGDEPPHPLGVGETGAARGGRDDRRDALVAVDAGDLLDEVLGGGEVGAPGRRGHREQVAVAGDRAADGVEDRDDLALEVDDADDLGREVDVHGHRSRRGRACRRR